MGVRDSGSERVYVWERKRVSGRLRDRERVERCVLQDKTEYKLLLPRLF